MIGIGATLGYSNVNLVPLVSFSDHYQLKVATVEAPNEEIVIFYSSDEAGRADGTGAR